MTAPEGTLTRLVCDPDLDRPVVPPTVVATAMFSGETVYKSKDTAGMPFATLGLADFSMEWFVKGRTDDSLAGLESKIHSGLVTPANGDTLGVIQSGLVVDDATVGNAMVRVVIPGISQNVTIEIGTALWRHVAVSVHREGDATYYLDGTVDATRDASPGSGLDLEAVPVHPLMGGSPLRTVYDNVVTDNHDSVSSAQCYLSSFAIHNRQLTPAEVSDAFAAKVVNNFGSGTTFVRYLFSRFVDSGGSLVTPSTETDPPKISLGCKDRIATPQTDELFVPIATPDTLFIEDDSLNGRHWPLLTQLTYGSGTLDERGICGFATTGAS